MRAARPRESEVRQEGGPLGLSQHRSKLLPLGVSEVQRAQRSQMDHLRYQKHHTRGVTARVSRRSEVSKSVGIPSKLSLSTEMAIGC